MLWKHQIILYVQFSWFLFIILWVGDCLIHLELMIPTSILCPERFIICLCANLIVFSANSEDGWLWSKQILYILDFLERLPYISFHASAGKHHIKVWKNKIYAIGRPIYMDGLEKRRKKEDIYKVYQVVIKHVFRISFKFDLYSMIRMSLTARSSQPSTYSQTHYKWIKQRHGNICLLLLIGR